MRTQLVLKWITINALIGAVSILITVGLPGMPAHAQNTDAVQVALSDYSDALAGKNQPSLESYSPAMLDLIKERQDFYKGFFASALHSELTQIKSTYSEISKEPPTIGQTGQRLQAVEIVELTGIPLLRDAKEYPMVRAALLASQNTTDGRVKQELDDYTARTLSDVDASIKQGAYTISWRLAHTILYDPKSGKIMKDSYSDIASDRLEGTDIVDWNMDTYSRQQPKIESFPDYEMYHSSIEELANGLLEQYNQIFKGLPVKESSLTTYTYSHTGAGNYIRTWVKTTTVTCSDGSTLQNTSNYNSSYIFFACNDCANFVSQALRYGGHPLTSSWTPYELAWRHVSDLQSFIIDNGRGQLVASLSYLGIGNIAFNPDRHVVMVSAINPTRYSAHTHDRLNASWESQNNRYVLIFVNPIP